MAATAMTPIPKRTIAEVRSSREHFAATVRDTVAACVELLVITTFVVGVLVWTALLRFSERCAGKLQRCVDCLWPCPSTRAYVRASTTEANEYRLLLPRRLFGFCFSASRIAFSSNF
jgi:hypothetical protein